MCPPGVDLVIQAGVIRLLPTATGTGPKPSVDAMLASIALEFGERAVGVILSGTGSDGAYGMREIHAAGGLTIAQDPGSAKYASMPQSAIDGGVVDRTVAADEVGDSWLVSGELDHAGDGTHVADTLMRRIVSAMHSRDRRRLLLVQGIDPAPADHAPDGGAADPGPGRLPDLPDVRSARGAHLGSEHARVRQASRIGSAVELGMPSAMPGRASSPLGWNQRCVHLGSRLRDRRGAYIVSGCGAGWVSEQPVRAHQGSQRT